MRVILPLILVLHNGIFKCKYENIVLILKKSLNLPKTFFSLSWVFVCLLNISSEANPRCASVRKLSFWGAIKSWNASLNCCVSNFRVRACVVSPTCWEVEVELGNEIKAITGSIITLCKMRKGENAKRQGWGYTYSLQKEHSREVLCAQWRTLALQGRTGQTVEDP